MNKTALTIFALLTVASLAATDDDKIRYLQHLKNMPISAEDAPQYFALTNGGFAFYKPPVIRDDLVRMAELDNATVDAWLAAESAPTDFPNGIAIPASGTNNPYMRLEATASGGVFAYGAHSSPYNPAKAESNRVAELQRRRDMRQEAKTVRTNMIVNINEAQAITVSATSSTAQVRSATVDLRRELIDAQRELRDLAGIVRQLLADPKD